MQQALRPYVTVGVALVGASMIAVTPVAAPPIGLQVRPVQLVDAWSDLFTESAANWQNILNGADSSAISQVSSAFLTNPLGVIDAFTNLTPTVTTDLTSLPGQISVELPPGLELGIAGLGAWGAMLTSINDVIPQLQTNPSGAFEDLATILNGFLNGQDNISLLNGTITIPFWNGILAPLQPLDVNLSLTNLVDALGLGNLNLTDLDLTSLLSQLGLGDVTLGGLFSDLGLSTDGLGTLLGNGSGVTTLGGLLNLLGLSNGLSLGSLSLTNVLSGLGLDTNVNLNSLNLDQVLTAFGLNPNVDMGLGTLLDNLGFGTLLNTGLGTELSNLGLLQGVLTDLNGVLGTVLNNPTLVALLTSLGLNPGSLLSLTNLETALNGDTVGSLLGGQTLNESLSSILTALGVGDVTPSGLTIGGLLQDLGFASSTGDLTLGGLLTDLGNPILGLNVTDLLNGLNVGDLLNDLGLSNLPLDLSNLGDVSQLTLGGLLGDLGLGDLANVSVDPFGGLVTELVDVVPQQILAALGM
ncbi:MAG TPA: hypothetical protein VG187_15490 [Mycobacterium sp.]|nr:hypothetical protein [Mycobacterium sp.]